MSFAITQEDVDLVRSYVTARDGHEYDTVEERIVCFDITHNYLKVRMHAVRMSLTDTVLELKGKILLHSGTPVQYQRLELKNGNGLLVCELTNENKTLCEYGFKNGFLVHCTDLNPNSLAKDGGLDDETQIEKKVMTDSEYDKRENTVRKYKLQMEAQRIIEGKTAETEYCEETITGISIGDRCEVNPGGRRGIVQWLGELECQHATMGGYWVGVRLDEPSGRNDGSYQGKVMFECPSNYGLFVRGASVTVGDYPEDEIDLDEEF